jgi:hypothetical protein
MGDPLADQIKVLNEAALQRTPGEDIVLGETAAGSASPPPAGPTAVLGPEPGASWRTPPRGNYEAVATYGEQGMAFVGLPAREGWRLVDGPSGAAGHPYNSPGFDGVAFRWTPDGRFELRIVDNKALSRPGEVRSASAITTNLRANLERLEAHIGHSAFNDVQDIDVVRKAVGRARTNVAQSLPLPSDVTLEVTNWAGVSDDVSGSLRQHGVRFRDLRGLELPPMSYHQPVSLAQTTSKSPGAAVVKDNSGSSKALRTSRAIRQPKAAPVGHPLADAFEQVIGPGMQFVAELGRAEEIRSAIERIKQTQADYRAKNPDQGVLVVVQSQVHEGAPAEVPRIPMLVSTFGSPGGRTLREAKARFEKASTISTGRSSAQHRMLPNQYYWIPSQEQEALRERLRERQGDDE